MKYSGWLWFHAPIIRLRLFPLEFGAALAAGDEVDACEHEQDRRGIDQSEFTQTGANGSVLRRNSIG